MSGEEQVSLLRYSLKLKANITDRNYFLYQALVSADDRGATGSHQAQLGRAYLRQDAQ
jgi:hypothetical protein